MSTTIRAGGLIVKGPVESEIYKMDWNTEHLAQGVTISTSSWTITRISGIATGLMTKDNESIVDSVRNTQLRLIGGTSGQLYDVTNTIITAESPARTKDRSFKVLIQDR